MTPVPQPPKPKFQVRGLAHGEMHVFIVDDKDFTFYDKTVPVFVRFGHSGGGGALLRVAIQPPLYATFLNLPLELREQESRFLAVRMARYVVEHIPPPYPETFSLTNTDAEGLVRLDLTDEEAASRILAFFRQTGEMGRLLDVPSIALSTDLPLEQVRQVAFQMRRDGVLDVYANMLYSLKPTMPETTEAARATPTPAPAAPFDAAVQATPLPQLARLRMSADFERIILDRWAEACALENAGAYRMALIEYGSVLEGLLLARMEADLKAANTAKAAPKDNQLKTIPVAKWTLTTLLAVAHELGWLSRSVQDVHGLVRDYRNYVHPREELKRGTVIDRSLSAVTRITVLHAAKDLVTNL